MLLVIRGFPDKVDPTYRCVSENENIGNYSIIEMSRSGKVEKKLSLPLRERHSVENLMSNYRSVFVDRRKNTIPLTVPSHAKDANEIMHIIRRQKSEQEKEDLTRLSLLTQEELRGGEQKFRGSASRNSNKCFFQQEDRGNFIQYRSGLQSNKGLCSDVAMCVGKNDHAHLYLTGLYRAIEKVQPHVKVGASFENLNQMLQVGVPEGVKIVGPSFTHIGYERIDPIQVSGKIQSHDVLNMNVTFRGTDGKDSTIHGGVFSFPEKTYRAGVDGEEGEEGEEGEDGEEDRITTRAAPDALYDEASTKSIERIADTVDRWTLANSPPDPRKPTTPPQRHLSTSRRTSGGRLAVLPNPVRSRTLRNEDAEGFDLYMAPRQEEAFTRNRARRVRPDEEEGEALEITDEIKEEHLTSSIKKLFKKLNTLFKTDMNAPEVQRRIIVYNKFLEKQTGILKKVNIPVSEFPLIQPLGDGESVAEMIKTQYQYLIEKGEEEVVEEEAGEEEEY